MRTTEFASVYPEPGCLPMQFDLIDIRLFLNIVDRKSVTQGAERSYMSAPAASVRIKNVEERLGTKLLYRTSKGVSPTLAGQTFLKHGRLVLEQLEYLQNDLRECLHGPKEHLRIAANTSAMTEFLPSVLSAYLSSHRDVDVDLKEHTSSEIVRAVINGTADVGILEGSAEGSTDRNWVASNIEMIPYRTERLVLATARNHPLARRKQVAFADTLLFDHIALTGGSPIQAFLDRVAGISQRPMKSRAHVGTFEALCRLVASNVGIGVLPDSAARRYAMTAEIAIIGLSDDWAARRLQACVRSMKSLPGFARDLIDLLLADGLTAAA